MSGARGAVVVLGALIAAILWTPGFAAADSHGDEATEDLHCTITGTDGDDVLAGTSGDDVICGGWGRDRIWGRGGNDTIYGGAGDDRIYGGPGDDKLSGGSGDDVLYGEDGNDLLAGGGEDDKLDGGDGDDEIERRTPLRNDRAWQVNLTANYGLPDGTKIVWKYDPPTGNCLRGWTDTWTDTVGAAGELRTHDLFTTTNSNPWDSCAYETSRGTWNFTATLPSGFSRSGSMRIETGSPNIYRRSATATCAVPAGIRCSGGDDSQDATFGKVPTPSVYIGPMDGPDPEPRLPELICTGDVTFAVGEVWNEHNAHLCTIEGFPRPSYTITGLPPGVTAARWPTANDTWVVARGSASQRWDGIMEIHAVLGDWERTLQVGLHVK